MSETGVRARRRAAIVALAFALASRPAAMSERQTSQQPLFRAAVGYVPIDVVVVDRDDKPVTGLTRDDFRVESDGRVQTVSTFAASFLPLGDRTIDLTALPPALDVATNEEASPESRAIVFVLDEPTLYPHDLVPIKRVMAEFLRTLRDDDRVAITYVRRSDLGQDFTNELGLLVAAVENLRAAMQHSPEMRATMSVLRNAVDSVSTTRAARRAIVYVGSGYPAGYVPPQLSGSAAMSAERDAGTVAAFLEDEYRYARERGVPIYTIDPRGLASPESVVGIGRLNTPQARERIAARIRAEQFFMRQLAEATGGRSFVNQSDLLAASREIIRDNGSYYVLGFYPTPYNSDGKFHDVKVSVMRPGVRVRARSGYVAEKPRPLAGSPTMLRELLTDGMATGNLSLRAFAAPLAPTVRGAGTYVTLDVLYPEPLKDQARTEDELYVAWIAIDPDARVRASGSRTITVPLAGAPRGAFTLSLHDYVDLPSGPTTLRVAVASKLLAVQGTIHLKLDVPRLAERRFYATVPVLGLEAGGPVSIARLDASNAAGVPFPATTSRKFAPRGRLHLFLRVFDSAASTARVVAVITRHSSVVSQLEVECVPAASQIGARDCSAVLPLNQLSGGEYTAEFVTSRADGDTVRRTIRFNVE